MEDGSVSKEVLENLAAGPIEDVLRHHGSTVIAMLEIEAKVDRRFFWTLKHVWRNEMDQVIWDRIQKLCA